MKIKGIKLEGPKDEVVVLPRGESPPIVFKARAVLNYDNFNKLVPMPVAPKSMKPGGQPFDNVEDPGYVKALDARLSLETAWMVIQSLSVTEGIEWENVKADDPASWLLWQEELKASGLLQPEVNRIFTAVWTVNALSERAVKEARETFFRSEAARTSS